MDERIAYAGSKLALTGIASVLAMQPGSAQELHFQIDGPGIHSFNKVASYVDITGDGLPEFLVSPGKLVWVLSGADGSVLHTVIGTTFSHGRTLAGVGDFDGDGVADFAAGDDFFPGSAPYSGRVVIYSGASGQELLDIQGQAWQAAWGFSLAGLGDVDGDGFADVAVGGFYGDVHLFRGPDATPLRSHQGPGTRPSVAGIGDVDGDGFPDYVIGWSQDSTGGLWAGTAKVFSGRTGALIHQVYGNIPHNWPHSTGDHLGRTVAAVGDLDGDGIPDFACGAPGEIDYGGGLQSRVLVFSGADASLLLEIDGTRDSSINSWFGGAIASAGDLNGDGVPDLVIGGPSERGPYLTPSGSVNVYSGRTGARLWRIFALQGSNLGRYVAMVGDLDGDGLSEFASGDAVYQNGRGRILVWKGTPADAEVVCPATPNTVGAGARLEMGGSLGLSSFGGFELVASAAPPLAPALFFYGPPATPQPFGDGVRCVGNPISRLGPPQAVDAQGELRRPLDYTSAPASGGPGQIQPGSTFTFQLWYRDIPGGPAGSNLSEALRATFAP